MGQGVVVAIPWGRDSGVWSRVGAVEMWDWT